MAIAGEAGAERERLLQQLQAAGAKDREALVRVAAVAAEATLGLPLDTREANLLRLARGERLDALAADDRASLEGWSRGLDVDSGFKRFLAWIAAEAFHLPLNGDLTEIRTPDTAATAPLLTLRSFSPYREEDD